MNDVAALFHTVPPLCTSKSSRSMVSKPKTRGLVADLGCSGGSMHINATYTSLKFLNSTDAAFSEAFRTSRECVKE